ncbi:MAG: type IV secretion system DNA-binding domain-containing protein [Candidatus Taylorbacteria bacterium]|nr:type IV secretion system DNA-binding domain-containing protein [Candidatus Taylorbacteria bacterium]
MDENRVTYFAETDARNKKLRFGIKAKDRTRHVYVIGKTGMGKSCLLENMAVQDIQHGEGICFIDPHGKTADLLLEYVPKERIRDVIYIAPFDVEYPISFNVLESVDHDKRHLVVSGLMSTFKKIWEDAWSARMEYILTNTLLALLECPGSTLLGVNRMLSDKEYRKEIVSHVQDPSVKAFWIKEFANYTERQAAEAVPAIQNKVGQFTANPLIRNMIGQPQSSFDFRQAMDNRKIILINLSKGRIGDENMKLLGGLLVTKIYLAAMSRADIPDRVMKVMSDFYLFVDEFQNFANASFADILSEARKYKLNLTIAHQYIEQMDEKVAPAVFGNAGTMIAFRVGATDAEFLEKEFAPQFVIEDLVNLGFAQIYLKLMIDGLSSPPFSATTLPPIAHPEISYVKEIIDASREQFSRPRAEVEAEVVKFHEAVAKKPLAAAITASSTVHSTLNSTPAISPSNISPLVASTALSSTAGGTIKSASGSMTVAATEIKKVPTIQTPITGSVVKTAPGLKMNVTDKNASASIPSSHSVNDKLPYIVKEGTKTAPTFNGNSHIDYFPKTAPDDLIHSKVSSVSPKPIDSTSTSNSKSIRSFDNPKSTVEAIKPVSLNVLTAKYNVKTDPKVRTEQNVNSLRAALDAAMKKGKEGTVSKSDQQTIGNAIQGAPSVKEADPVSRTPQIKSEPISSEQPKEVPEEVLNGVLKV